MKKTQLKFTWKTALLQVVENQKKLSAEVTGP